jgi:hypothetical protein
MVEHDIVYFENVIHMADEDVAWVPIPTLS